MTRAEVRARFLRHIALGLERAEREDREHLAAIRRLPKVAVDYNPSGALKREGPSSSTTR